MMTPADTTNTQNIPLDKLFGFVEQVLVAVGVPQKDARIVADCLTTANLSGMDSHGVVRLAHYVRRLQNGTIKTVAHPVFEQTSPSTGILDGDDGLGHVVTWQACTEAIALARESGSGVISIRNSSHFGMTGFYIKRLVEAGMVGMAMTDTDAFLIPFGSRKPFFGTNPLAIGFPTDGIPCILDMATTSVPYGKLALAQVEGRQVPADWGFDADGNPTTDPNAIAGLHPIAGPKGSGLAMMIGVFCSVLSGMPFGPHINKMYGEMDQKRQLGHFIMAIDTSRFMPLDAFKSYLGQMLDEMQALPPIEGFKQVLYPGQLEGMRREQRAQAGIPIAPGLTRELQELGAQFNISFPA